MGYLNNVSTVLDAVLTKKGREILSDKGQEFTVTHFAVSDDEVDYGLWNVAHPEGTDSYGKVIENLPLLEPTTDLQTVMKYKLVTRMTQPTKGCLIDVNSPGIKYVHFDHTSAQSTVNQSADGITGITTRNFAEVLGLAGGESYTVTLLDASVLGISNGSEEGDLFNNITQTSQTIQLPAGTDISINVKAFNAPSSSDELASQPAAGTLNAGYKLYGNSPQTTIIITGNMSGATLAINVQVASLIS